MTRPVVIGMTILNAVMESPIALATRCAAVPVEASKPRCVVPAVRNAWAAIPTNTGKISRPAVMASTIILANGSRESALKEVRPGEHEAQ